MSKFCKNCGSPLNPDVKFCASCGEEVSAPRGTAQPVSNAPAFAGEKRGLSPKKLLVLVMAAVFALLFGIGLFALFSGGGKYPFEKGAAAGQSIRADREATVGDLKKTGWQLQIPRGAFDSDADLTMEVLSETDAESYKNSGFEFIGTPVEISAKKGESVYLDRPVTVTLQIPKGQRVSKEKADDCLAAYWNGKSWDYIFPDITKVSEGQITFETYHFSIFSAVKPTEKERIKLYTQKMAVQTFEDEEREKAFSDKVMDTFGEAFEKMGVSDESVKGKLLRSVAKEYDFGTLLVSTEQGDIADFGAKCGEMAANALIEHMKSETKYIDDIAGKGAAVAGGLIKGAMELKDGNYTDAAKELSSAFIGYFPVGRAYQATAEVIDAGIASWKDYELDEAYRSYVKDSGGAAVTDDDWALMCATQMRGYLIRLQDEARDRYCAVNGISKKELEKDTILWDRIAAQTEANLRKAFERRLASEQTIKAKEGEYEKIIEGFRKDGLLERGDLGFAFRMDIENRLRTLFAVRKNILDLFGGEMPILQTGESAEANLNEAVSMWIIFGPKNRGEFYKWLEEKGYKRESKQTSGEYAWVLVDVLDFENADDWERADAHEAYACTYSYARGSYSASTTYEGYDTYGEGKKGTLGALAVYSGMPDIIYPDKPVTLKLSFTTTQNDVVKLYFTANTSAWFDLWDMASGVTGGARDFVNADGKSSFNIKSLEGPSSYSETLTATLGQGSEGERIALILKLSLGASMRTNYVYEWKQVG